MTITISDELSPQETAAVLRALADYHEACGTWPTLQSIEDTAWAIWQPNISNILQVKADHSLDRLRSEAEKGAYARGIRDTQSRHDMRDHDMGQ